MKIHLLGPTCSGTSTLGKLIADSLNIPWFDTDELSWVKTDPPFTTMKERAQRIKNLKEVFEHNNSLVLSGAVIPWGNFIVNYLDIVIYKYVDQEIRLRSSISACFAVLLILCLHRKRESSKPFSKSPLTASLLTLL
jgi:hypothetical protein